jgi:hypothetical protein
MIRQDKKAKARQGKARQDKARQDLINNTREDHERSTRQEKTTKAIFTFVGGLIARHLVTEKRFCVRMGVAAKKSVPVKSAKVPLPRYFYLSFSLVLFCVSVSVCV